MAEEINLKPLMNAVAEQLSMISGRKWAYITDGRSYLLSGNYTIEIDDLYSFRYSARGRIKFTGLYQSITEGPEGEVASIEDYEDYAPQNGPSCTVKGDSQPGVMAAYIMKKLLPRYIELFDEVFIAYQQARVEDQKRSAVVEGLGEISGIPLIKAYRDQSHWFYQNSEDGDTIVRDETAYFGRGLLDAISIGEGMRVRLVLSNLTVGQTRQILKIISPNTSGAKAAPDNTAPGSTNALHEPSES